MKKKDLMANDLKMRYVSNKRSGIKSLVVAVILMLAITANFSACVKTDETLQATGSGVRTPTVAASLKASATTGTASKSTSVSSATNTPVSSATDPQSGSDNSNAVISYTAENTDGIVDESEVELVDLDENETPANIDLGGRTITFDLVLPVRVPTPEHTVTMRRLLWEASQIIEKKYNCKFEFLARNIGYANMVTEMLAGVNNSEVLYIQESRVIPNLVEAGFINKLDDYISKDSEFWGNLVEGLQTWKGYNYGIVELGKYTGTPYHIVYNRDMMNRLGIDIWDYVNKDMWNWETFLSVAQASTIDFNGDGIIDQWGLRSTANTIGLCLVFSNNGDLVTQDGDRYYFSLNSRNSIKALQFLADLYNIHKVTYDGGNFTTDMQTGKAAMSILMTGSFSSVYFPDPNIAANMIIAPIPKGPDSDSFINGVTTSNDMLVMPVIQGNPNREVVIVVADLYNERYKALSKVVNPAGAFGESWFMNNLANAVLYEKIIGMAKQPFALSRAGIFGTLVSTVNSKIFTPIAKQAIPITTTLTENESILQGLIDSIQGN